MRERLRIDGRALRSQVARRLYAVFLVCAIVPMGSFAGFAFWQVRAQLEDDARDRLHHASKAAGMSIFERLMLAEEHMRLHALGDEAAAPRAVSDEQIVELSELPWQRVVALLDDAQRTVLGSGRTVLRVSVGEAPPARIQLFRALDPGAPAPRVRVAEVEPRFVFEPRRPLPGDQYWVEDAEGRVLFEMPEGAARHGRKMAVRGGGSGFEPFERDGANGREFGVPWSLFLRARYAAPAWTVSFSRPMAEVHRPLRRFEAVFPLVAIATLASVALLAMTQVRRSFVPIDALTDATRRLARGDLDARVEIDTGDEFAQLGRAFNGMTDEIGRQIRILKAVNGVGRALSEELETDALLDIVLREAMRATGSRGAALFLGLDRAPLALARMSLAAGAGASAESAIELPVLVAERCFARSLTRSHGGLAELPSEEREAWQAVEPEIGFGVGPQVAVPLRDNRGDSLGVLILFRDVDAEGYSGESCSLAESLASQAATALIKNHMVDGFRALFEGVVGLTVRAIDEKSSYTGDHCRKVPILTEMITEAACKADRGPLKDFDLDADERYELHIAALLHDCGKVATPVHVMDKATKLETICDRIELVDTRFEIIRRDIEAAAQGLSEAEMTRALARLEEDRAFVRSCNQGSEGMTDEEVGRVRAIADAYSYASTSGERRQVLSEDEVRNLSIRRGTLNPQERAIIEQHVVTTMELLSELRFPGSLAAVPEIAGSHHERVDGSGYPRSLTRDQITMQGRILGLADVFEALTARDRPYKPGRTLSETFRILDSMCAEGAIDPDLYELFKREKVYLPYVAANVDPGQVDGVYWEELELFTGSG